MRSDLKLLVSAMIKEVTGDIDVAFRVIGLIQIGGASLVMLLLVLRKCGCAPVLK